MIRFFKIFYRNSMMVSFILSSIKKDTPGITPFDLWLISKKRKPSLTPDNGEAIGDLKKHQERVADPTAYVLVNCPLQSDKSISYDFISGPERIWRYWLRKFGVSGQAVNQSVCFADGTGLSPNPQTKITIQ
jgi:hypothetical protein